MPWTKFREERHHEVMVARTMMCNWDREAAQGRSPKVALGRKLLALVATVGMSACHYDVNKSTIDQRGVSGVAPLNDGGFAFAIYPCADDDISRLELVVTGLGKGTDYVVYTTVLRAEFDPPRSARQLLISTSPSYHPPTGVKVEILDQVTLDRFNNDRKYLTSWSMDKFFAVHAWDREGHSLPVGASLHSRFDAKPGQIVLADSHVDNIGDITCATENSPAWRPGDN